jgi:hypothetical protein
MYAIHTAPRRPSSLSLPNYVPVSSASFPSSFAPRFEHTPSSPPLHPFAIFTSAVAYSTWNTEYVSAKADIVPPAFTSFCSDILSATNLSASAILLGLYYIFRLRHCPTFICRESEFYILVLGLTLSNKFLEDSTFTNKTWTDLAKLDLLHFNSLERVALISLDYNLNVREQTYESWLSLLSYPSTRSYPFNHIPYTINIYQPTFQPCYPSPVSPDTDYYSCPSMSPQQLPPCSDVYQSPKEDNCFGFTTPPYSPEIDHFPLFDNMRPCCYPNGNPYPFTQPSTIDPRQMHISQYSSC